MGGTRRTSQPGPELPTGFFNRDAVTVARGLLGKRVRVGRTEGIIVETEAYAEDDASHAVLRRRAARPVMESVGRVYVYRSYGVHLCLNFTCDPDRPSAVLVRALEPTAGVPLMARRRGIRASDDERQRRLLCGGPGRLTQALGVVLEMNDTPIGERVRILDDGPPRRVIRTPRIGITRATELLWRFVIAGNPYVSRRARNVIREREEC